MGESRARGGKQLRGRIDPQSRFRVAKVGQSLLGRVADEAIHLCPTYGTPGILEQPCRDTEVVEVAMETRSGFTRVGNWLATDNAGGGLILYCEGMTDGGRFVD